MAKWQARKGDVSPRKEIVPDESEFDDFHGICDTCGVMYELWSRNGRCGDCGECKNHCSHEEGEL